MIFLSKVPKPENWKTHMPLTDLLSKWEEYKKVVDTIWRNAVNEITDKYGKPSIAPQVSGPTFEGFMEWLKEHV